MNAETLRSLREKVDTRKTRLMESSDEDLYPRLKRLWPFLHDNPLLKGVLAPLAERRGQVGSAVGVITSGRMADENCVAENDLDHAAIAYNVLAEAVKTEFNYHQVQSHYAGRGNVLVNTKNHLVLPLFDYLTEALDEQQVLLGHLLRYAQRSEWFDRSRLHALATGHGQAAKGQGKRSQIEDLLQSDLYRYLHDQGVNFVIEPYSDRGEIDLIADQRGADPKYIEVKVFDNKDKDKAYLRAGFHQLVTYLGQYKASVGYLAVFKL